MSFILFLSCFFLSVCLFGFPFMPFSTFLTLSFFICLTLSFCSCSCSSFYLSVSPCSLILSCSFPTLPHPSNSTPDHLCLSFYVPPSIFLSLPALLSYPSLSPHFHIPLTPHRPSRDSTRKPYLPIVQNVHYTRPANLIYRSSKMSTTLDPQTLSTDRPKCPLHSTRKPYLPIVQNVHYTRPAHLIYRSSKMSTTLDPHTLSTDRPKCPLHSTRTPYLPIVQNVHYTRPAHLIYRSSKMSTTLDPHTLSTDRPKCPLHSTRTPYLPIVQMSTTLDPHTLSTDRPNVHYTRPAHLIYRSSKCPLHSTRTPYLPIVQNVHYTRPRRHTWDPIHVGVDAGATRQWVIQLLILRYTEKKQQPLIL